MSGESRIDILIAARDEAKDKLKGIEAELKNLGAGGEQAQAGVSQFNEQLVKMATLAGAVKLGQVVFELAQTSATADRTRAAFDQLAIKSGTTGDAMLASLRKASAGTIADSALVVSAIRARDLGVVTSTEQTAKLLEVAAARGAQSGVTTADAFDVLVKGIGRGSAAILDNVNILLDDQSIMEGYAASVGKTVDQLSKAEKSQAIYNAVVKDSASIVESNKGALNDSASSFERLSASIENAKVRLGQLFAPTIAADIETFVGAIDLVEKKLDELGKNNRAVQVLELLAQAANNTINPLGTAASAAYDLAQKTGLISPEVNAAASASDTLTPAANAAGNANEWLATAAHQVSGAMPQVYSSLLATVPAFGIVNDMATATSNKLYELQAQIIGLENAAVGRLASAAAGVANITDPTERQNRYNEAVTETKNKIDAIEDAKSKGLITYSEEQRQLAEVNQASTGWFDTVREGHAAAISDSKKWANTVESDLKKAYEHVAGAVSGVLQGALKDVAGVNPDEILRDPKEKDPKKQVKLLPYDDAINENAKRLADIAVNGFKGQDWLGKFKAAVPDIFKTLESSSDPRAAAAHLLKDFQDGLEPELLDKEKAKERVRKMLIGEQKMADLAKEITTELNDELGNTAPADLAGKVSQALGGGAGGANALSGAGGQGATAAGTAGGSAAGAAFSNAAAQAGAGAGDKLIAALDASLKADANVTLIKTAGQGAGNNWGGAFLSTVGNNVPKALIDLLTNLVTPGVLAYFNTQSQLTGAQP